MTRTLYTGTTEYLDGTVTADVTLDTQAVVVSFDRTTWIDAAWTGSAATTRGWRALIPAASVPGVGGHPVYVRVTDDPETPIVRAGEIEVV